MNAARDFEAVADYLLFDAKPSTLPGGNATRFDWSFLCGVQFRKPWILAGGLNVDNVQEAVTSTGATIVDVSSGVEDAPGIKSPAKIEAFLAKAIRL